MQLNVIGDPEESKVEQTEVDKDAMGGTELMKYALAKKVDPAILDKFQIIPSRVRELEKGKIPIYWLHDLPGDPESEHLHNGGWKKFEKIVAVSHWQRQQYQNVYQIPSSKIHVLQNAIEPIDLGEKEMKPDPAECINLIYHTTPHRGLELLLPIMDFIEKNLPDLKWHLDVYSSFDIYGPNWKKRNEPYQPLFDHVEKHPNMTYHGFKPNEEVKEALKKAHIFCLPSIWTETSCIAMIEAMSAGCLCVHSSLGALPETTANWSLMYDFSEDQNEHATRCAYMLADAMQLISDPSIDDRLSMQKAYIDGFYNWDVRAAQWTGFLNNILKEKGIDA